LFYIFYGADDFSRHEALQKLMAETGINNLTDSSATVLDGKSLTMEQLANVCHSIPFFASQRLVIVEGLLQRFAPKRAKNGPSSSERTISTALAAALEAMIPGMPASTVLILVDGDIKSNNPLLKRLHPLAKVRGFPGLKGEQLHDWIQDKVTTKGGRISPAAARLVVDFAGANLWSISNEIDKLLLYASGPTISESDVRETMSYSRDTSEFAMVDAMMARRTDVAQRLLHQLLDEGTKAPQIIAFVVRELGLFLKAREALDMKLGPNETQAKVGIAPSYRLDKAIRHAKACTLEEIRQVYGMLLDADISLKTGAMSEELTLDILLADVCRR